MYIFPQKLISFLNEMNIHVYIPSSWWMISLEYFQLWKDVAIYRVKLYKVGE